MADVPGDVTGLLDVGIALASMGAGFGWEEGLGRAGRWARLGGQGCGCAMHSEHVIARSGEFSRSVW